MGNPCENLRCCNSTGLFSLLLFLDHTTVWLNIRRMSQKDSTTIRRKDRTGSELLIARATPLWVSGQIPSRPLQQRDGLLEELIWRTCVRPGRSSRLSWGNAVVNVDCYVQSIGCPVCLRPGTSGGQLQLWSPSRARQSVCCCARLCRAESSAYVRHAVRVFDDKTSDGPTGKNGACVQRCARTRKHLSCSCGRCRAASALYL